ncbi:MAG: hypothetical protein DRI69_02495 [Bacteroidetes bacterium]|nr:MAG: hypothetical protein DRI69_02495 [Bacteroidota bacterium]
MPQINTKSIITFFSAAAIVLVIWFLVRPATDTVTIAEEYLHPYPNLVSPIQQRNSGESTNYDEAFRMYELGYHSKAEDFFMSLDQTDEAVQFYRSLNALLAHDSEAAEKGFADILVHPEHRFYETTQWYSALESLLSENRSQANMMLEVLSNGDSEFAEKAQKLLNELN